MKDSNLSKGRTPPHKLVALVLLAPLFAASISCAQGVNSANTLTLDGAIPSPAKLEELAWLAGYWRGTGLGGECEEL